jgi:hypothetical protein
MLLLLCGDATAAASHLELHGLSTLSTQLARDNDLATLGTRLHNKAQHTIASPANEKHSRTQILRFDMSAKHVPAQPL